MGADLARLCGVLAEPLTTTQIAIAQISLWFPVVMIVVVRTPKPSTLHRQPPPPEYERAVNIQCMPRQPTLEESGRMQLVSLHLNRISFIVS